MLDATIWCCGCGEDVTARLTDGREVYPGNRRVADLPFWRCDGCGNWVGCHHKTRNRTRPLGCIPTPDIKNARQHLHRIIDPLWKQDRIGRRELYARIAEATGREKYHTADVRSVEEAREIYRAVAEIEKELKAVAN